MTTSRWTVLCTLGTVNAMRVQSTLQVHAAPLRLESGKNTLFQLGSMLTAPFHCCFLETPLSYESAQTNIGGRR